MPQTYIEPLDLRKLLLEYFIGDGLLFAFFFLIVYSYSAAKFQFTNKIYYTLLIVGSLMFGVYMGEAVYVLILVLVGAFSFKAISRYVS